MKNRESPPKLLEVILEFFLSPEHDSLLGDLAE